MWLTGRGQPVGGVCLGALGDVRSFTLFLPSPLGGEGPGVRGNCYRVTTAILPHTTITPHPKGARGTRDSILPNEFADFVTNRLRVATRLCGLADLRVL